MLMSTMILNFHRTSNNISTSLDFNRFRMEALSILTSNVEQLSMYYFDEASTDTTSAKRIEDFVQPNWLGEDQNDDGAIDDIDDLHGVTLSDTGLSGVPYNVDFALDYVSLVSDSIAHSEVRQYHKRVKISVSDSYDPPLIYQIVNDEPQRDTLRMEVVVSYWFFN